MLGPLFDLKVPESALPQLMQELQIGGTRAWQSRRILLGGRSIRFDLFRRDGSDLVRHGYQMGREADEVLRALVAALIHVERAVDLELDRVDPDRWVAIVFRDEAPGIGFVAAHRVAKSSEAH